jgi:hypothetical protein
VLGAGYLVGRMEGSVGDDARSETRLGSVLSGGVGGAARVTRRVSVFGEARYQLSSLVVDFEDSTGYDVSGVHGSAGLRIDL